MRFDCLIIGDIVLDVFFGMGSKSSFVRGGTSYCEKASICWGGSGNVAAALSHLGAKTCFIGKSGCDLWGITYKRELQTRGVVTRIFFDKARSTGLSLITVGERGERSFHVFRGANDELSAEEIDKSIDLIKSSRYLYFSGYSLVRVPQRDAILHAVNLAKENGLSLVFDPGAHNLILSNVKLFRYLQEICDVFCLNLDEAKAIAGTRRIKIALNELRERGKITALKCGSGGSFLITRDRVIKTPAYKVRCIDSTGAGDAFVAGIVYGLINHLTLESAAKLANWFAAQVTTGIGARNFPLMKKAPSHIRQKFPQSQS